jgi:hydrogenase-4 component F
MIETWSVTIVAAPLVAAAICAVSRHARIAEYANLAASVVCVVAAISLACIVRNPHRFMHGYVMVDALAAWTLLCTALVYCLASIYAVGYMRLLAEERPRLPNFYALFALFAATMVCGPIMNNIGVYWIAIELTTKRRGSTSSWCPQGSVSHCLERCFSIGPAVWSLVPLTT